MIIKIYVFICHLCTHNIIQIVIVLFLFCNVFINSIMESSISTKNSVRMSGQLYKYTNVMKGWQYRWFSVDSQSGLLSYYLCENAPGEPVTLQGSAPRGEIHLAAAVVCPSDEDSKTFTINCASGDMMKLRASDARARQEWVDGLRAIAESHTKAIGVHCPPLPPREHLAALDAMGCARQQMQQTELSDAALARAIESSTAPFSPTDPDLLLLKATSAASTHCLLQCLGLLQRQRQQFQQDSIDHTT